MKIKENNNVRASIFARAVFLLQEEEDQETGTANNKILMNEIGVKKKSKYSFFLYFQGGRIAKQKSS